MFVGHIGMLQIAQLATLLESGVYDEVSKIVQRQCSWFVCRSAGVQGLLL